MMLICFFYQSKSSCPSNRLEWIFFVNDFFVFCFLSRFFGSVCLFHSMLFCSTSVCFIVLPDNTNVSDRHYCAFFLVSCSCLFRRHVEQQLIKANTVIVNTYLMCLHFFFFYLDGSSQFSQRLYV